MSHISFLHRHHISIKSLYVTSYKSHIEANIAYWCIKHESPCFCIHPFQFYENHIISTKINVWLCWIQWTSRHNGNDQTFTVFSLHGVGWNMYFIVYNKNCKNQKHFKYRRVLTNHFQELSCNEIHLMTKYLHEAILVKPNELAF